MEWARNVRAPTRETSMRPTKKRPLIFTPSPTDFGRGGAASQDAGQGRRSVGPDPLQELAQAPREDFLDDGDLDDIGDLGNGEDEALDIDYLIAAIDAAPPSSRAWFIQRAGACLRVLRSLRLEEPSPWEKDRVPERRWRALADEALGLVAAGVDRGTQQQALLARLPESQREGARRLLDSTSGMDIFRRAFVEERDAWEKAYWRMAIDQAFGKIRWTGPQGWRDSTVSKPTLGEGEIE